MSEIICTRCGSTHCKKNGHIHNGKQNHRCKGCGRQFVMNNEQKIIPEWIRSLILKALLERLSLRGICRTFSVSLTWLLSYVVEVYEQLPAYLNLKPVDSKNIAAAIFFLEVEADEMWSFVGNKDNKQWIWIVIYPIKLKTLC